MRRTSLGLAVVGALSIGVGLLAVRELHSEVGPTPARAERSVASAPSRPAARTGRHAAPVTSATASASDAAEVRKAFVAMRQHESVDDPRYRVRSRRGRLDASNPEQGFDVRFDDARVEVRPEGARSPLTIATERIGCGDSLGTIEPNAPQTSGADARRVEYARTGAVQAREWFLNGAAGLEQGYDVASAACGDEPLVFDVALGGFDVREVGGHLVFADAEGLDRLAYGDLFAEDADGRALPARMQLRDGGARLEVDVRGARFPVVVDPLVVTYTATLGPESTGYGEWSEQAGFAVAISGDLAALTAPSSSYTGTVYVFSRSGVTWSFEQRFVAPGCGSVSCGGYGSSVAISGNTLAIGYNDWWDDGDATYAGIGYVQVHVRSAPGNWSLQATLTRSTGTSGENFGASVAIDGNVIVAGAPGEGGTGAVHVFTRTGTTWSTGTRFTAPSPGSAARFGTDVAIQGTRFVVGEPGRAVGTNGGVGAAHLFEFTSGWSFTATMYASDGMLNDQFGYSVDVDGTTLVVGAPYDDVAAMDQGSAYVFVDGGATVTQQAKLLPSSGMASSDYAGFDVAVSGDVAVVGAPGFAVAATDSGAALVYTRTGSSWTYGGTRTGPNARVGDSIGRSVAMDLSTALVGAPGYDEIGRPDQGAAIAFAGAGLPFQSYVATGRSAYYDSFGGAVAVSGDTVVVGVPQDDSLGLSEAGCAYVFVRSGPGTFTMQAKLTPAALSAYDNFGTSVAIDGNVIVVGAPNHDGGVSAGRSGAVFVFRRNGTTWGNEARLSSYAPQAAAYAGQSVAVDGTHLVFGSPYYDGSALLLNVGRIDFYEYTGGTWVAKPVSVASGSASNDQVGSAVDVQGNLAVAGAPITTVGATSYQGAAYVYRFQSATQVWSEQFPRITGPAASQRFGQAVTVRGTSIVVGAPAFNSGRGAIHVFTDTGSAITGPVTISAATSVLGENFGTTVDYDGEVLAVGAVGRGRVFYPSAASFTEQTTVNPPSGFGTAGGFGTPVAISGGLLAVGANTYAGNTVSEGRVLTYSVAGLRGHGCSTSADCGTGFCVDNVCCNTACGGGSLTDCQACSVAAGGAVNGTCGVIAPAAAYVCRAADASGCDAAETCGGTAACPADSKVANNTPCGGSPSGACDAQDTCQSGACQANFARSTTQCQPAMCSGTTFAPAVNCTGSATTCPSSAPATCGGGYVCDAAGCLSSCSSDIHCGPAYYCGGFSCTSKLADGVACTTNNQCLSGTCGGVCGGTVDECALNIDNCHANATCTDQLVGFTCACNTGFTGSGTSCTDVDECTANTDNCALNATCTNVPGSFTCACNTGYTGNGVTCTIVSCGALASPTNGTVSTPSTTYGATATYGCSSGYAPSGSTTRTCQADGSWSGAAPTCDDVDECLTNNGGCSISPMVQCTNTVGSSSCGACPVGYAGNGTTCTDVNECTLGTDTCSDYATCTNTNGSFSCTCNGGYSGNGITCADINECSTGADNCSANATCTNTQGNFLCSCNAGYSGSGTTCSDIDECLSANGGCSTSPMVQCTNTTGSFACGACPTGYTGNGTTCTDVDECALGTDNCGAGAACTNAAGSFSCTTCSANATVDVVGGVERCVCNGGYGGDGVTCVMNACNPACGTGAVCNVSGASYVCACPQGYGGNPLTACTDVNECQLNTDNCSGNATCTPVPATGWYTCACNGGFTGDGVTCADVDECATGTANCSANAFCTNTGGSFICTCNVGFNGDGVTCVLPGQDAGIVTDAGTGSDAGTSGDAGAGTDAGTDGSAGSDAGSDAALYPYPVVRRPNLGVCSTADGAGGPGQRTFLGSIVALAVALAWRRRHRGAGLASLLVALTLGSTASAQTSPTATPTTPATSTIDESVARAQFQLGQAYLNEGRFHEAAVAFESAYTASNRPGLLYNAYVAYRDAQELENAANALRRFLAADPTSDTPLMRGRLEAIERQLEAQRAAADAAARAQAAQATPVTTPDATTASDATTSGSETTSTATTAASSSGGGNRGLAFGLIGGGGGLAAIGMLAGGLGAAAQTDRIASYCGAAAGLPAGQCYDAPAVSDAQSKTTMFRALAWGSLGVGVSAAAVGTVLLLTGGHEETPAVSATASCDRFGCSVTAFGRF